MQKFSSHIANFITILGAVSSLLGLSWGWFSDAAMLECLRLDSGFIMSIYGGLSAGCLFLLVALNWKHLVSLKKWHDARKPEAQLEQLYSDLTTEFDLTRLGGRRNLPRKIVIRRELKAALERLGINTPEPRSDNDIEWTEFLVNLLPLAKHRRLDEARRL